MLKIFVLVVLIILVFSTNTNTKKRIEGYDARYKNMDISTCADFCKTTAGCFGFGYADKTCFPSKTTIDGKPYKAIFKDYYSESNVTCNKVNPIIVPNERPSFVDRRINSIYICSEKNKQPIFYYFNNGKFDHIGEGKNIDEIIDVDEYEVRPYKWPINKFDFDNLDLLIKEYHNRTYVSENVTDINKIK